MAIAPSSIESMDLRIGKSENRARAGYLLLAQRVGRDIKMKLPHAPATATALIILAAAIALPAPARAQTYDPSYPVCLQVYQGMVDFYFECHYRTMAQCAASASGRSAQCVVNPYYGGPNAGRSKRQKRPQPY
jgi:hypothetical protein